MLCRLRRLVPPLACLALLLVRADPLSADDGATLYKQLCASCHEVAR